MGNKVLLMHAFQGFLVWVGGNEHKVTSLQFNLWQSWWKIIGNLQFVAYISFEGIVNSHAQCYDNFRYRSSTSNKRLV